MSLPEETTKELPGAEPPCLIATSTQLPEKETTTELPAAEPSSLPSTQLSEKGNGTQADGGVELRSGNGEGTVN